MHQATWNRAEELLRESETWIFIGYSMPAADYQFKHLLKRVHLSRLKKPELLLITKTSLSDTTVENYRRFFGGSVLPEANVMLGGIDRAALNRLREVGALL